jgi:hypothetical protein
MKKAGTVLLTLITISLGLISCNDQSNQEAQETFYFVTRLGVDTLAVERIILYPDSIAATALLRSPQLQLISYGYSVSPNNQVYRAVSQDPMDDKAINTEIAEWKNDSLNVRLRNGEIEKSIAAVKDIVPFVDMIHWPFELMLKNAYALEIGGEVEQQVWSGTSTFKFKVKKISSDSMAIIHPSRGAMGVSVNETGGLLKLDASQTTRKLLVTRYDTLNFEEVQNSFIRSEKSGKGIGALSGSGNTTKTVLGVSYEINYGTPSKRGREIWGSLVKYGERWRTGANRATHFKINTPIQINELMVPAGEYTLFTIPYDETCELIINKQTGQNGRTYDPAMDLGRVEMISSDLPAPVESFTIDIIERNNKAFLSLQWDMKSYEVELKK